jgi:hypothetical protein
MNWLEEKQDVVVLIIVIALFLAAIIHETYISFNHLRDKSESPASEQMVLPDGF